MKPSETPDCETVAHSNVEPIQFPRTPSAFKPLRVFIAALGLSLTACPPARLPDECQTNADCKRFVHTLPFSRPNQWGCLDEEEVVLDKKGHVDHVKHTGRKVCAFYCGD